MKESESELMRAAWPARILIVDDQKMILRYARRQLELLGYVPIEAQDGETALEILRCRDDIDLMMTDIVMPEMNGRTLARKAHEICPDLKIIFSTGSALDQLPTDQHRQPTLPVLCKPYRMNELARMLYDVLREDEDARVRYN